MNKRWWVVFIYSLMKLVVFCVGMGASVVCVVAFCVLMHRVFGDFAPIAVMLVAVIFLTAALHASSVIQNEASRDARIAATKRRENER